MKELRLRHLFATDRRTVILAMDHAGFMGPSRGLEDPGALLDKVNATGIDAVLTTAGIASACRTHFGHLGLILRVDGGSTVKSPQSGTIQQLFTIEDALRMGADAVACMGMIGFPEEPSSLKNLSALTAQSTAWNLPVLAEMLVKGKNGEPTPEEVGFAMRVGAELGADLIKAQPAQPFDEYQTAMQSCYRPVVVLGGAKIDDELALFESVNKALDAGASGVAIGRNIWQHPDPGGMCRALVSLVHGGRTPAEAYQELKR